MVFDPQAKRVLIVDFNHMAYSLMFGAAPLSASVTMGGETKVYDTTIANGATKSIHRWSHQGYYPTAICFDRPCAPRKNYFKTAFDQQAGEGYKENRVGIRGEMMESITLTLQMLMQAGLSVYGATGYEADDLVQAAIVSAKENYPGLKIDVVTNDSDLIPLVDDEVSVFLRSRKTTWAEHKSIEKTKYVQVTPENYSEVSEDRTEYKNSKILVPYNSLLLVKILRGDASDNIAGLKKQFPPRKVNKLIEDLFNDKDLQAGLESLGTSMVDVFRYRPNGEELIRQVLSVHIDDEEILDNICKTYVGMNLNQPFDGGTPATTRTAARLQPAQGYDSMKLFRAMQQLGINLPMS